jgi:hypothetical protein
MLRPDPRPLPASASSFATSSFDDPHDGVVDDDPDGHALLRLLGAATLAISALAAASLLLA